MYQCTKMWGFFQYSLLLTKTRPVPYTTLMNLLILEIALLFSPLVLWNSLPYPHAFPRWIWLAVFSSAIIIVATWRAWRSKRAIRINRLDVALTIFVAVLVVAALVGADPAGSWWSSMPRLVGVSWWVLALGNHFALKQLLLEKRSEKNLIRALAVIVLLMCAWGVAQKFIHGFSQTFSGDRIGGTLGNAIFFGMYAVLAIFIFAFFWTEQRTVDKRAKTLPLICCSAAFIILIFTASRGPFAGLALGMLVAFLWMFFSGAVNRKKIGVAVGVIVALLFCIVLLLKMNILSTGTVTTETRLINWRVALSGLRTHPVLGVGPENYRVVADELFDPRLSKFGFQETYTDKPHNAQLELGATTGVLGLCSYGALIFIALLYCRTLQKRDALSVEGTALLIGFFVAHEIQNAFAFETQGPLILFFFMLTILSARYDATELLTAPAQESTTLRRDKLITRTVLLLTALPSVWVTYTVLFNELPVAYAMAALAQTSLPSEQTRSIQIIATRGAASPIAFDAWQSIGEVVLDPYWSNTAALAALPAAEQTAWQQNARIESALTETLADAHAQNAWWQLAAGRTNLKLFYIVKDPVLSERAKTYFETTHALAPLRVEPLILLGQLELHLNNFDAAELYFKKAIDIDMAFAPAHWFLALTYFSEHNPQAGWNELDRAIKNGLGKAIIPDPVSTFILKALEGAGMHTEAQKFSKFIAN